jgi:protein-ribulosamine 3-kinase
MVSLIEKIRQSLENFLQKKIESFSWHSVGGGCINECFEWKTSAGIFFVKVNDAKKYPNMFESEAKGLQLLHEKMPGFVPNVIGLGQNENDSWLILEWIERGKAAHHFSSHFARTLSGLHRSSNEKFGLDYNNYIGSLPQDNQFHDDWISFFAEKRIEPMLKRAVDQNEIDKSQVNRFSRLYEKLEKIIPKENAALLHGDLWSGNLMVNKNGEPVVVDPAVYYGHREMDLSMMKLFGGFDKRIFEEYEEIFPLEKNFDERCDLHNLYPLLVHTILFGGHYSVEVLRIVKKFS